MKCPFPSMVHYLTDVIYSKTNMVVVLSVITPDLLLAHL